MKNFCNPDITVEAWYVVCKSKELKTGTVKGFAVGAIRLAIRRFHDGQLVATHRYCPHMGTDLILSKETGDHAFRCAFHGLEFNSAGNCTSHGMQGKSGYQLCTYPIQEKYGLIWVYAGVAPTYEIPELNLDGGFLLHLPSKKITAHHHIVICNPLDSVHVGLVHSLQVNHCDFTKEGVCIKENVLGTYRSPWMKFMLRSSKDTEIQFSSYGPSVSVADAKWHNNRVVILFTARQDENNKCHTNTAVWIDSYNPLDWLRALTVILIILKQDIDILSSINVKTNFTEMDKGMILFTDLVNSMPVYSLEK